MSVRVIFVFWFISLTTGVFNWLFSLQAGRLLHPQEFAILSVFLSLLYLINIPANALSLTIARFTSYYRERKDTQKYFYFFRQYWWLSWGLGITFLLTYALTQNYILQFFSISPAYLMWIFAILVIPLFLLSFETGALLGQMSIIWIGLIFLLESLAKFLILYLIPNNIIPPLTVSVISLSASTIIAWSVCILVNRSYHLQLNNITGSNLNWNDSYQFLVNSFLATAGLVLLYNLDFLLVKHFMSVSEAGTYSILSLMGKVIFFSTGSLSGIVIPLATRSEAKNFLGGKSFMALLGFMSILGGILWLGYLLIPEFIQLKLLANINRSILPYLPTYSLSMLLLSFTSTLIYFNLARKNYLPAKLTLLAVVFEAITIYFLHNSLSQIVNTVVVFQIILLTSVSLIHILKITPDSLATSWRWFSGLWKNNDFNKNFNRKRILILNWRDCGHKMAGGAEVYIQEMAENLAKLDYDITIFTSNDGHQKDHEIRGNVQIVRRGGFITVYVWAFLYYIVKFQGNFDLIIDSENGIPFFSPLYTEKPTILLVHHVHDDVFLSNLFPPFSWIASLLENYFMPYIYRSSFLVSVSLSTAEELQQKLGLVSSAIIPSGINLHNFIKTPKSHQPLISYVGRIKKYKNLETLLTAFKKIVTTYPNAQLRIAGEGDYLPVLNKYAMSHNLYNHVKFLGKISHQQKVELLGKSWIMVQPSYKEGWGITCIEANACQTPVIASRVSGLIDAVKDDINGYLFEYGDVEDLFEKISNLLADHKKRSQLSQSALLWSKQFSWEEQITKYHTLIKRALTLQSNQTFSRSFNSIYEKI